MQNILSSNKHLIFSVGISSIIGFLFLDILMIYLKSKRKDHRYLNYINNLSITLIPTIRTYIVLALIYSVCSF
jgi:hypothetical protein